MAATAQPKYFDLGQRIRRARKRAGISQERLAGLVGITRRHLIRIENGEHLPSRDLRDRLATETTSSRDELAVDEDEEDALMAPSLATHLHQLAQLASLLERNPDLMKELA